MTSSHGYPDDFTDVFRGVIDAHRCASVRELRRCQLWAGHAGAHAHAWLEGRPRTLRRDARQAYPWHPQLVRWDDERCWPEECGREPLRWACMFSA